MVAESVGAFGGEEEARGERALSLPRARCWRRRRRVADAPLSAPAPALAHATNTHTDNSITITSPWTSPIHAAFVPPRSRLIRRETEQLSLSTSRVGGGAPARPRPSSAQHAARGGAGTRGSARPGRASATRQPASRTSQRGQDHERPPIDGAAARQRRRPPPPRSSTLLLPDRPPLAHPRLLLLLLCLPRHLCPLCLTLPARLGPSTALCRASRHRRLPSTLCLGARRRPSRRFCRPTLLPRRFAGRRPRSLCSCARGSRAVIQLFSGDRPRHHRR